MEIDYKTFCEKLIEERLGKTTHSRILEILKESTMMAIPLKAKVMLPKPDRKCGQILMRALIDRKNEINPSGMSVCKMVEGKGDSGTTYLRYDAVIKYCNQNFICVTKAKPI